MFLETKQLGALIMIVIFKECKQYGNEKTDTSELMSDQ